MATVDTLLVRIEADMSQLKNQLAKTQSVTKNVTTGMKTRFAQVGMASNALANQFSLLKTAILGLGVGFLANSVIKANAEMEDLQRTLTTVFGTAKQGEAAFKFINIFAQRTPFDIQTLTRAFIQLKGAGIAPTEKLITTLGNAASVTTDKIGAFESLVKITTRAVGGGLGLEELEQLVTKGIPVYKILEEELGITRAGVTELGKSAEGAAQIMEALNRSFDKRFPNAMAEASGNLSVQLSNLGIAINNAFLALGESGLNKEIKNTIVSLTDATTSGNSFLKVVGTTLANSLKFLRENFKNLSIIIGSLIGLKTISWAIGTARAIIQLGIAISTATRLTAIFAATFSLLQRISKGGIIGIGALVAGLISFREELGKAINDIGKEFGGTLKDALKGTTDAMLGFFGLSGGFEKTNEDLKKLEATFNSSTKPVISFTGKITEMREQFEKTRPSSEQLIKEIDKFKLLLENMQENNSLGKFNDDIAKTKIVLSELEGKLKETEPMFMAIKNAAVTAGNSISDTFASALVNGKFSLDSLKDIFKSFVQQIISQAIRLMIVNKIINSLFGLTGTSALPTASIGGQAGGGTVQAKTPVMVGERGPELFIPNTGGVVKNNMDTKGMVGGGKPIIINQNINISTGVAQTVRAEVMNLMPQISQSTISAIVDAKQRGGSFATIMS
jgi:hypothetical protein